MTTTTTRGSEFYKVLYQYSVAPCHIQFLRVSESPDFINKVKSSEYWTRTRWGYEGPDGLFIVQSSTGGWDLHLGGTNLIHWFP